MKVRIHTDDSGRQGLLLIPETDFEADYLENMEEVEAFLKHGVSPADLVGLKICPKR